MKYIKNYESFNGNMVNELFASKAKKEQKKLDELKNKAFGEIEKYNFKRLMTQPAQNSSKEDIEKGIKIRLTQAKTELPTVSELLPKLFDESYLKNMTIYDDKYKDVKLLLPLEWQFILKDSFS